MIKEDARNKVDFEKEFYGFLKSVNIGNISTYDKFIGKK